MFNMNSHPTQFSLPHNTISQTDVFYEYFVILQKKFLDIEAQGCQNTNRKCE